MGRLNKKHHYIPQSYLRNFSHTEKGIYTYDKINLNSYLGSIDNVCSIDDFYRLSKEYIKEYPEDCGKELIIECDYFANNIESQFVKILDNLIAIKSRCIAEKKSNKIGLDINLKEIIAKYIVIQFLRLPSIRKSTVNIFNDNIPQLVNLFKRLVAQIEDDPKLLNSNLKANCDPALFHGATTFMNEKLVNDFAAVLANNYWSFRVSETGKFYTSDSPFAVIEHSDNVRPKYFGLAQYGVEVTFPISKDLILTIWDKEYFANKRSGDCVFTIVDAEEEIYQNYLRYYFADRHVFSYHNDFRQIEIAK